MVNFSAEPDVTRLVDAGLVDAAWKDDEFKGIVSSSVVTLVVRKGNPKDITDWDDLLEPGVEVVTPNPSLRLGEVEPARPVRAQERRRQGPRGGARLPDRPHQPTSSRSRSPVARRRSCSSRARVTCC